MRQSGPVVFQLLSCVLVLLILTLHSPLAGQTATQADLTAALRDERAPGIVWSIVDGEGSRNGALGYSNARAKTPLTTGHKVHVGSVAKTLIALGALQLVSEGRLSLDTPVERILPDIRFDNRWGSRRPVRVRHLLDHTAGLEDARIWQLFSTASTPDTPLVAAFRRDRSVLRLRTPPGETFSYSNMGYALAAMVIERVGGERYETRLDRELLKPLGMVDSTFLFTTQTGRYRDPRLAWGHLGDGSLAAAIPAWVRPAAQFTTTAADMSRFARFLMGDGRIGGRTLIDAALLRRMGETQGTLARQAGLETGYGLGLGRRDREGSVGLCHQGDTVGYHALLCLYPAQRKAFFLAVNVDGDDLDVQRFHRIVLRATGPRADAPPPSASTLPDVTAWLGHYIPVVSRFSISRYTDLLDGGASLAVTDGKLFVKRSGRDPLRLIPDGPGRFRAEGRAEASHVLFEHAGQQILSDGQRSYRRTGWAIHAMLWGNMIVGVLGLAYFVFVMPVLIALRRRGLAEPALLALLAFIPAGYLIYRLPFTQWGDMTGATGVLAVATAALPIVLLVQIWRAASRKPPLWKADVVAAVMAMQWVVVLAHFGLVPVRLWA